MKIYRISQNINDNYDTYDSAVVCAENEKDAGTIHPSGFGKLLRDGKWISRTVRGEEYETEKDFPTWVRANRLDQVVVEEIGEAKEGMERGVILASFNAG